MTECELYVFTINSHDLCFLSTGLFDHTFCVRGFLYDMYCIFFIRVLTMTKKHDQSVYQSLNAYDVLLQKHSC